MRAVRVNGQITEVKQTKIMVSTKMGDYLDMHYVYFQFGFDKLIYSWIFLFVMSFEKKTPNLPETTNVNQHLCVKFILSTEMQRPHLFHKFPENRSSQILAKIYSMSILFHRILANFALHLLGTSL